MGDLSAEQKSKRKERLKKMAHVMLWVSPATQIQMAGKTIRDETKKRRASRDKQPLGESAEKIVDGIQKAMAMAIAKNAGLSASEAKGKIVASDDPLGMALALISKSSDGTHSIDSISEKLTNSPSKDTSDVVISAEVLNSDGGSTSDMALIFAKAKAEADKLGTFDKSQAIIAIGDLQKAVSNNISTAKTALAGADQKDIAEVKNALAGVPVHAVATTVKESSVPTNIGTADSEEKSALGSGGSFLSNNKKTIIGIGLIGLAYYLYAQSNKAPQGAAGGAVGAVAGGAPTV